MFYIRRSKFTKYYRVYLKESKRLTKADLRFDKRFGILPFHIKLRVKIAWYTYMIEKVETYLTTIQAGDTVVLTNKQEVKAISYWQHRLSRIDKRRMKDNEMLYSDIAGFYKEGSIIEIFRVFRVSQLDSNKKDAIFNGN